MDFAPDFIDGLATIVAAAVVFVATFVARLLRLNIQEKHREVLNAAVRTAALALLPRLIASLADTVPDETAARHTERPTRAERRTERALLQTGVLEPDNPDVREAVAYVKDTGAPVALKALVGTDADKQQAVVMEKLTAAVVAEMKEAA